MSGLDRDVDLKWRSPRGRMLGNEIGMDKQFLRSIWFLLYQWGKPNPNLDHHNILVYQKSMLIDTPIEDSVSASYISPNIGDPSNIPLKYGC
jgi:hypothetical protein